MKVTLKLLCAVFLSVHFVIRYLNNKLKQNDPLKSATGQKGDIVSFSYVLI